MSETLEESVTMPETVSPTTISDISPSDVSEDRKRHSASPEKTENEEEKLPKSPSDQTSTNPTPLSAREDTEVVTPESPTPTIKLETVTHVRETSTPGSSLSTSFQAASGLGVESETQNSLQNTLPTDTDGEIPSTLPQTQDSKVQPMSPTFLPSAPVSKSDTVTTTPGIPSPRKVSFPADPNTQVTHLSPSGCDKEPLGGHRTSFIEMPGGNISDTPATSVSALVKLWVVVIVTLALCVGLMVAAHLTHSLTLRVEAYHSLYNAGALVGSLLSIKLCRQPESLQNTFGWARIDVVSYLISLIFLSSLCFSVAVEAVQTAAHVQHQDPMHYPMATILVAVAALGVNALVFALIGGYTQHQGSFMEVRVSGEVFVKKQVRQDSLQTGQKTLSSRRSSCPGPSTLREGYKDVLRDIAGLLLTIACATIVLQAEGSLLSFYIDPAIAMVSVSTLVWLSFPFGKECSNILLQTIPEHIDVERFSERLQETFPAILNVHHLHIWSLRPGKVVSTIHVVFASKDVYRRISSSLTTFFNKEGISLVTLQPEFMKSGDTNKAKCCCSDHLLDGAGDSCDDHAWHPADDDHHDHIGHDHKHDHHHHSNGHSHEHNHKQKHGHTLSDHEHSHKHGHGACSEHHEKPNVGNDLPPTNTVKLCAGHTDFKSNSDYNMTPDDHTKLHEHQVHQRLDDREEDLPVKHEKATRHNPDLVGEDRISTSSEISENIRDEHSSRKASSCCVSHEGVPLETDPSSDPSDELQKERDLRTRSTDDEPEQNGVVAYKVGTSSKEDCSLDGVVSNKPSNKEVVSFETSESLKSTTVDGSTKFIVSSVTVKRTSSIEGEVSCKTGNIETRSTTCTHVSENVEETSTVNTVLNVPKIEITLRELIVSDEQGNLLFSDMRYASGCPDVEVIGSPSILRKASSESHLLENPTESAEMETKPRSDSALSVDENSAMLAPGVPLSKDGSNFSLTRSVEKLSGPENDHSI